MKKVLIFIGLLSFYGCTTSETVNLSRDKEIFVSGYSFLKYSEMNFLFTPEQYLEDYESVGLIQVEIFPEVKKGWVTFKYQPYNIERITPEEVLDSLYYVATKMGADAVVRLNIESMIKSHYDLLLLGIRAYGFAIKRK